MEKLILFVTALFLSAIVFAQQTPETKPIEEDLSLGILHLPPLDNILETFLKKLFIQQVFSKRLSFYTA